MAEAVITRARGLFQYADLGGDTQAGGMVWTRKKKTLALGGTVSAILLIIIIAAAAKHHKTSIPTFSEATRNTGRVALLKKI